MRFPARSRGTGAAPARRSSGTAPRRRPSRAARPAGAPWPRRPARRSCSHRWSRSTTRSSSWPPARRGLVAAAGARRARQPRRPARRRLRRHDRRPAATAGGTPVGGRGVAARRPSAVDRAWGSASGGHIGAEQRFGVHDERAAGDVVRRRRGADRARAGSRRRRRPSPRSGSSCCANCAGSSRRSGPDARPRRRRRGAGERHLADQPTSAGQNWVPIGPTRCLRGQASTLPVVSGRVQDLAISTDGRRVYVATANGGVWRSLDARRHLGADVGRVRPRPRRPAGRQPRAAARSRSSRAPTPHTTGSTSAPARATRSRDGGRHRDRSRAELRRRHAALRRRRRDVDPGADGPPDLVGASVYAIAVDPTDPDARRRGDDRAASTAAPRPSRRGRRRAAAGPAVPGAGQTPADRQRQRGDRRPQRRRRPSSTSSWQSGRAAGLPVDRHRGRGCELGGFPARRRSLLDRRRQRRPARGLRAVGRAGEQRRSTACTSTTSAARRRSRGRAITGRARQACSEARRQVRAATTRRSSSIPTTPTSSTSAAPARTSPASSRPPSTASRSTPVRAGRTRARHTLDRRRRARRRPRARVPARLVDRAVGGHRRRRVADHRRQGTQARPGVPVAQHRAVDADADGPRAPSDRGGVRASAAPRTTAGLRYQGDEVWDHQLSGDGGATVIDWNTGDRLLSIYINEPGPARRHRRAAVQDRRGRPTSARRRSSSTRRWSARRRAPTRPTPPSSPSAPRTRWCRRTSAAAGRRCPPRAPSPAATSGRAPLALRVGRRRGCGPAGRTAHVARYDLAAAAGAADAIPDRAGRDPTDHVDRHRPVRRQRQLDLRHARRGRSASATASGTSTRRRADVDAGRQRAARRPSQPHRRRPGQRQPALGRRRPRRVAVGPTGPGQWQLVQLQPARRRRRSTSTCCRAATSCGRRRTAAACGRSTSRPADTPAVELVLRTNRLDTRRRAGPGRRQAARRRCGHETRLDESPDIIVDAPDRNGALRHRPERGRRTSSQLLERGRARTRCSPACPRRRRSRGCTSSSATAGCARPTRRSTRCASACSSDRPATTTTTAPGQLPAGYEAVGPRRHADRRRRVEDGRHPHDQRRSSVGRPGVATFELPEHRRCPSPTSRTASGSCCSPSSTTTTTRSPPARPRTRSRSATAERRSALRRVAVAAARAGRGGGSGRGPAAAEPAGAAAGGPRNPPGGTGLLVPVTTALLAHQRLGDVADQLERKVNATRVTPGFTGIGRDVVVHPVERRVLAMATAARDAMRAGPAGERAAATCPAPASGRTRCSARSASSCPGFTSVLAPGGAWVPTTCAAGRPTSTAAS